MDYEKIRILREQASHSKKKDVTTAAGELENLLSGLSEEREYRKAGFRKGKIDRIDRKGKPDPY